MFKNKFFLGFIILCVTGIAFYSLSSGPSFKEKTLQSMEDYKTSITTMEGSPTKGISDPKFDFYEPSEDWQIEADFKAVDAETTFNMNMTDSTKMSSKLAGEATFKKEGKNFKILIFEEEKSYLLPFKDKTNGKDTYGGGRYINIPKDALNSNKLSIDFNMARNFYCAYSESYICPIPPSENSIDLEIRAGEKNFQK